MLTDGNVFEASVPILKSVASASAAYFDVVEVIFQMMIVCPECGSTWVDGQNLYTGTKSDVTFKCNKCGHTWALQ